MSDDDDEQARGYLFTHWDCPDCGDEGEPLEGDAQSEQVECDMCGWTGEIGSVK